MNFVKFSRIPFYRASSVAASDCLSNIIMIMSYFHVRKVEYSGFFSKFSICYLMTTV